MKKIILLTIACCIILFSFEASIVFAINLSMCSQKSVSVNDSGQCDPFDFDASYGFYNDGCKLKFNLMDCPNVAAFRVGTKMTVQMQILTQGVYFSKNLKDELVDELEFIMFSNEADIYDITSYNRTFGEIKYSISDNTQSVPMGGSSCSIPSYNKVNRLISSEYIITSDDAANKTVVLWINVPPMRIDTNETIVGDIIRLKVIILRDGLEEGCENDYEMGVVGPVTYAPFFDVDDNGKMDLKEAIYILQILTSGQ